MIGANLTLIESIKQILESLQIRYLLPSTILVLSTIYFFSKINLFSMGFFSEYYALIIFIVVVVGYLLSALNFYIIKTAEGYYLSGFWKIISRNGQENKFNRLKNSIKYYDNEIEKINSNAKKMISKNEITDKDMEKIDRNISLIKSKKRASKNKIKNNFPKSVESILPTSIGNTMLTLELYAKERYNINSIALWPRMFPVIQDRQIIGSIQEEKFKIDLLLNSSFVFSLISIESLLFFGYSGDTIYFFIFNCSVILSYLFFTGANASARNLGRRMCVAFDLYRNDLRKALSLKKVNNFDEEQKQWENFSLFISHGKKSDLFDYKNEER